MVLGSLAGDSRAPGAAPGGRSASTAERQPLVPEAPHGTFSVLLERLKSSTCFCGSAVTWGGAAALHAGPVNLTTVLWAGFSRATVRVKTWPPSPRTTSNGPAAVRPRFRTF